MSFSEAFETVRPSVVAFMPSVVRRGPDEHGEIFPIIGTGVILDDGIVATNDHVIEALFRVPRPPDFPKGEFPFIATLFHRVIPGDHAAVSRESVAEIPLRVRGVFKVEGFVPRGEGYFYGPAKPDLGIVQVNATGLPKAELEPRASQLVEGIDVGTIGYPMGTEALTAPGWLHQFGPFLQRGIISAILPTRCNSPHGFVINLMSMGGASGSPVFLADTGRVIGIINSGLVEPRPTVDTTGNFAGFTQATTPFTYVVPAQYLASALNHIKADARFALPPDTPTLADIIKRSPVAFRKDSGQIPQTREPRPATDGQISFEVRVEEFKAD
jgi:hypothetical protein